MVGVPRGRSLPASDFARHADPGFVKIAWSLWVEGGEDDAVLQTETRAVATDAASRRRLRKYWWLESPGIRLIRRAMLGAVRARMG